MKRTLVALAAVSLVLLTGCGDDSSMEVVKVPGVTPSVGTATSAFDEAECVRVMQDFNLGAQGISKGFGLGLSGQVNDGFVALSDAPDGLSAAGCPSDQLVPAGQAVEIAREAAQALRECDTDDLDCVYGAGDPWFDKGNDLAIAAARAAAR